MSRQFKMMRYDDLDQMKSDEYIYWQQQTTDLRMKAVADITNEVYHLKDKPAHVRRLQRILVRIERE